MARKKTGRRRGRPINPRARRHQRTRAGRRGLVWIDPNDYGSDELRAKKIRLTGQANLELNGASVLFGHDHIDRLQFDTLGAITELLQRIARAWGQKDGSVTGLWLALLSASTSARVPVIPVPHGADAARYKLGRVLRRLDGSRDLVIQLAEGQSPPVITRVIEGRLSGADERILERLRQGLDALSGRRTAP
jgi:hypothetical protein